MNDGATTLIVPGRAEPAPEPVTGGIGPVVWAVLVCVVLALGLWAGTNGRRRRRTDPRELAFRRIAHAQGWSRAQIKALRREASAMGLGSPVGLAASPTLAGTVFERRAAGRGPAQSDRAQSDRAQSDAA